MSVIDRRTSRERPRPGRTRPRSLTLTPAQDAALQDLFTHHKLTEHQAYLVDQARRSADQPAEPRRWFAELAGYLGGALVLGGGALLLGTSWDQLTGASRSALRAAAMVVLTLAGLVIAGGPAALSDLASGPPPRRRVTGALFAVAAGTSAGAAGVLAAHRPWVTAAVVGLIVAAVGYALAPAAFGLLATQAFGVVLAVSLVAGYTDATPLKVAGALVATGVVLAGLTELGLLVPRNVALGVAAGITVVGAQQPLAQQGAAAWGYGLTFAMGLACLTLYWLRDRRLCSSWA